MKCTYPNCNNDAVIDNVCTGCYVKKNAIALARWAKGKKKNK